MTHDRATAPGEIAPSPAQGEAELAAREAIAKNPVWYHTIELAPGVITPGRVDLRRTAGRVLPDDLRGLRALDVGTFDGFWAFEIERRGADVVSIDIERIDSAEWPPRSRARLERDADDLGIRLGLGFRLASDLLGSRVERLICNVYELSQEAIHGPVDFAFSGALMLHLRDPVRALERIFATLVPGGEVRIMEPISMALTLRFPRRPAASFQAAGSDFNWWVPNAAGLGAWLRAAGFEDVRRIGFARPPSDKRMRQYYAAFSARRPG